MMKLIVIVAVVAAASAQICCNDNAKCIPFGQICDETTYCYTSEGFDHICRKSNDPFDPWIQDGWVRSNNYVYKLFTDLVDYDTAASQCLYYTGTLAAEVLRQPEVASYIIDNKWIGSYTKGETPWIGYKKEADGIWRWVDEGETNPQTTEWNAGEPNNTGGKENRARIAKTTSTILLLDDYQPTKLLQYICEVQVI